MQQAELALALLHSPQTRAADWLAAPLHNGLCNSLCSPHGDSSSSSGAAFPHRNFVLTKFSVQSLKRMEIKALFPEKGQKWDATWHQVPFPPPRLF